MEGVVSAEKGEENSSFEPNLNLLSTQTKGALQSMPITQENRVIQTQNIAGVHTKQETQTSTYLVYLFSHVVILKIRRTFENLT